MQFTPTAPLKQENRRRRENLQTKRTFLFRKFNHELITKANIPSFLVIHSNGIPSLNGKSSSQITTVSARIANSLNTRILQLFQFKDTFKSKTPPPNECCAQRTR